jgi:outer membrane protein assembly factor BamB
LQTLWTFRAKDGFENTVAVADGVVYAASMDEHLYAIDLARGKQKWKFKGGPFKAPVAFRKDRVYVGDLDGTLYCVDARTGTKKWIFEANSEVSGANFHGEDVLIASHDEHLYCLTKDGKERWKYKTDGPIYGTPAVASGKTFVAGCDNQMHVLDIPKGTLIRSVNLGGQTGASACVVGDELYLGMRSDVKAINWKKGEINWTFRPVRGQQFASAAATDKYIVISGRDRKIYAVDSKKGTRLWSFPTGGMVDSSPVIVGTRVIVGSQDSNLYVLDLATGKKIQEIPLDGPINASPVVVDGKVLIGTQKGTLYCLGAKKPR